MPDKDYIIMSLTILYGVIMIISNKPLFFGGEKYTEESLKRYPRPAGVWSIIFGGFGLGFLYSIRLFGAEKISGWVPLGCVAGMIIGIIGTIVVTKKTLVKKK